MYTKHLDTYICQWPVKFHCALNLIHILITHINTKDDKYKSLHNYDNN